MTKVGDIITHVIDEARAALLGNRVSPGHVAPVLVTGVDEENGTVTGTAFLPDGTQHHIAGIEPAPVPDAKDETPADSANTPPATDENSGAVNTEGQ